MCRSSPRFLAPAAFVLCLLSSALAGRDARAADVKDDGSFFSAATISQLQEKLGQIKQKYDIDVAIETYPEIPADLRGKYNPANKQAFYDAWLVSRGKATGAHIVILITKQPGRVQVGINDAKRQRLFTAGDRAEVEASILGPTFASEQFDQGILRAADFIDQKLAAHTAGRAGSGANPSAGPTGGSQGKSPSGSPPASNSPGANCGGGTTVGGLLCLVVGGLVIFFLVRGIFNRNRGAGYGPGGPGYGPGYGQGGGYGPGYGGGYGGGGGGFGSGMLGGLLGGVLGGYAGNRLFGQHGQQTPPDVGGTMGGGGGASSGSDFGAPPADTGPASTGFDFGGGGESPGSDFGSGGGSDFGSSGSDFGGGGSSDFGGGGDSGSSSGSDF